MNNKNNNLTLQLRINLNIKVNKHAISAQEISIPVTNVLQKILVAENATNSAITIKHAKINDIRRQQQ